MWWIGMDLYIGWEEATLWPMVMACMAILFSLYDIWTHAACREEPARLGLLSTDGSSRCVGHVK